VIVSSCGECFSPPGSLILLFRFSGKSSVLGAAGCHQVASCCDPDGELLVGSSIFSSCAVFLGPSCDRGRVLVGFRKAAPFSFLLADSVAKRNRTRLLGFGSCILGVEGLKNPQLSAPFMLSRWRDGLLPYSFLFEFFPLLYVIITGGLSCFWSSLCSTVLIFLPCYNAR